MTTSIENPISFEDLSKILNVNKENYAETINEFINKFIDIRNQTQREIYRFRFSEIDSIVITVSDVMDILDTRKADQFILDISLKYCIDVLNNAPKGNQVSPFNFDSLKKAKSGNDILSMINNLGKLESQDILGIKDYPFTMKGFVVTNDLPRLSLTGAVSNLPSVGLKDHYKENLKSGTGLISTFPDYVFSVNLNIGISNFRSSFMR